MQSKKSHRSRKSASMFVVDIWQLPMGWCQQENEFEFSWAPWYTSVISLTNSILLAWCFRLCCQHYTEWTCDIPSTMPVRLFKKSLSLKKTYEENRWGKIFDSQTTARIVLHRLCTWTWTWDVLSNVLVIPRLPFLEKKKFVTGGAISLKRILDIREETWKHLYRSEAPFQEKLY